MHSHEMHAAKQDKVLIYKVCVVLINCLGCLLTETAAVIACLIVSYISKAHSNCSVLGSTGNAYDVKVACTVSNVSLCKCIQLMSY